MTLHVTLALVLLTGIALLLIRVAALVESIRHLLWLTGQTLAKLGEVYVIEAERRQEESTKETPP